MDYEVFSEAGKPVPSIICRFWKQGSRIIAFTTPSVHNARGISCDIPIADSLMVVEHLVLVCKFIVPICCEQVLLKGNH